jgi:hypothetical protein
MRDPQRLRMHDLRRRAAALATDIEHVIALEAYLERTGHELSSGERYTKEEAASADENHA